MRAVTLRQHPYVWVPPFEGVSRRHEPSIVSKASEANDVLSPVSKAAPTLHKTTPVSAAPRFGKMPYVAYLERSSECSTIVIGTAIKPSPTSSRSSEVGERRWVSDTVINIQNGDNGDGHANNPWTVSTMHASAPTILSVIATRTATHPQPSDGLMPLNEMMSRQHGLNVVSKTPEVYSLHSRSLETAQRRSNPPIVSLSYLKGEGQLARAAAYIQERIKHRSFAVDESPYRSLKEPLDEPMEDAFEPQRIEPDVVVEVKPSVTNDSSLYCPESTKPSHALREAALGLPDSSLAASVTGGQDLEPRQLERTVEAARCSDERLKTEGSVLEEPVTTALQILECKWFSGPTKRQSVLLDISKVQTSTFPCLSIVLVALTPCGHSPAFISQALPASQPSYELSGRFAKSREGDCE